MATETTPSTDLLPVPRAALLQLGLTDEQVADALTRAPAVRGGRPWEYDGAAFDVAAVDRVLRAMGALRHTKTSWRGRPLVPDPWQVVWVIAPVFGWLRPDGTRVIREAFIEVPRKNGKTTLSTGLLLVLLCADGEPGPEVYSAAFGKAGAQRILTDAKAMVRASPGLLRRIGRKNLQAGVIKYPANGGVFLALSKLAEAAHGLNVSGAVIDELHLHRTRHLVDAITTGTGARDQPLVIFITTSDEGDEHSIYGEKYSYTEKLADRVVADPSFWGAIWRVDEAADPFAESTWRQANPGYGVTVHADYLRREATKAKANPAYLPVFRRLHTGVRARGVTRAIGALHWDRNGATTVDEARLEGRACFAGLDLSAVSDLTALVLSFPDDDRGGRDVIARFWVPEDRLAELEAQCLVPLAQWRRDGWLTATEGNVVDYRAVRAELVRLRKRHTIIDVGYDPWNATETVTELVDDGFVMVPVRQGYWLSPAAKSVLRLVQAGGAQPADAGGSPLLRHGGNPVLRWNALSAELRSDENGNVKLVKPDRAQAAHRVDGMSALAMAEDGVIRRGDSAADDLPAAGGF